MITVEMGRENAGRFVAAAVRMPQTLNLVLTQIGTEGAAKARSIAPGNGGYKDKIGFEVTGEQVSIGSASKKAHIVEKGRGPGTAPPRDLIATIFDLPRNEAFRVAQAIGRNGTQGANVMELTRLAMRSRIPAIAERVVRELGAN